MLTDMMMKPLGSTYAFSPELGPQERLLLPFPVLPSFDSLNHDSFASSRGEIPIPLNIGNSMAEKKVNSARKMRMLCLRMAFRIDTVLEELLLPVRNNLTIQSFISLQGDILRLRTLFEAYGRILAIQEGGPAGGAKSGHLQ
jgi:hypothetical protein